MYSTETICQEIPQERQRHPKVEPNLDHAKLKAWKEATNKCKNEETVLIYCVQLGVATSFLWAQGVKHGREVYSRSYIVHIPEEIAE